MGRPYKIKRHKRIYRRSAGSIVLRVVVIVAAIAVLFGLGWALYAPVSEWIAQRQNPQEEQDLTVGASDPQEQDVQETPVPGESEQEEPSTEAQGVSMTAYLPIETVRDSASFTAALQAAKDAGYDSIMFDLKTDDGTVTYSISYNEATDARVTSQTPVDLNAVAQQILDAGLTPVASIYTFHDHLYPLANNDAATWYAGSESLWVDDDPNNGGHAWLNPFSEAAQGYIQKIVDDACDAGFQMIVLQDVQFPEGYSLDMIDYFEHAEDDKHAFLQQFVAQMTEYAAAKGVELTALFPASSMLGGDSEMYFGDAAELAGDTVAVDLRAEVFGSGLQTDLVSIPDPAADPYSTVHTASAALRQKLPDNQMIALLDSDSLESRIQGAGENGIERYIVDNPALS